jgi:dTDP-4-dehydrorhamnose 3,5-epimerase
MSIDAFAPSPVLIEGGCHADARGSLSFINGFNFQGVDRFYWVQTAEPGIERGWVGHQREHKWFAVVHGEVLVSVVRPDDWQSPSRELPVTRYVLSATSPQVLHVPSGHATGSVSLTPGAILVIFSSGNLVQSKTDDFRFPVDYWAIQL